jgi:maleate isomerase
MGERARADGALPFATDAGVGGRARLGLVVLASDQVIEHEWRLVLADLPGVALYHARLYNDAAITPATLRAMEALIRPAASLILPGLPVDVLAYGCTSASMLLGEARVAALLREARPEAAVTNPVTALLAGLRALRARRIALLTPYRADVNAGLRRYLEERDLAVVAMGSFLEEDDRVVGRIAPESVRDAAIGLGRTRGVEAVVVACTSLRVVEVTAAIEAGAEVPVTSSNHAMLWHALRLARIADPLPRWGRLFATGLDA